MKLLRDSRENFRSAPAKCRLPLLSLLVLWTNGCAGLVSGNGGAPGPQEPVKITNVQATAWPVLGFQVSWLTNIPANSQVEYGTSPAYGSTTGNAAVVATHKVALSNLTASTVYHYRVRSVDAKNNQAMSIDFTFATADSTPPTVSIASPAAGTTLSGIVNFTANATDNIAIANVQFQVDGGNVGNPLTTAPYSYSWDTTKSSNGSHTLTAVAKDTAGNSTTSATNTVTVNNALAAPVVSITAPTTGTKVAGTVVTTATATSGIGVANVQFHLDGGNVGNPLTTAPYSYSWDTTKSSNGSHTLTVVAKDTAGNTTISSGTTVNVNNISATPPTVLITAPTSGATMSGVVTAVGTASSSLAVSLVQISVDGGSFSNAVGTNNWNFSWDTASFSNGSHTITAKATDSSGGTALSNPVSVSVSNVSTGPTVTVNWFDVHQVIDGFGAASVSTGYGITDSQADLFWSISNGVGLSLLRVEIQSNGSYPELATMQKAKDRGVRIWGTPWSPPASMKTNGSLSNGGNLLTTDYQVYADYLAGYVDTLKNSYGIDLYAFSIQNEPNWSAAYSSCIWSGQAFHDFLGAHLQPAFAAKGLTTKIILPESAQWSFDLATATLSDPVTAADVSIVAAHNYDGGGASSYPLAQNQGKHLWETEVSSFESFDPSISNGLRWAQKINDWMTIANANAWHYWWLVSGNSDNEALLGPGGVTTKRLYVMGNYSKFVRPGYYRVGTSASPVSGVSVSAYKDPNSGKFAIVAINHNSSAVNLNFSLNGFTANSVVPWVTSATLNLVQQSSITVGGGTTFGATLPAQSVTTFDGL